ncbi:MAG: hypothetical protein AAF297_00655 [Planctomycetota bacterium]
MTRTVVAVVVAGAAVANAQVWYGSELTSGELYRLNIGAGEVVGTAVGASGFGNVGLAFDGVGNLFGHDTSSGRLLSINTSTGAATTIGFTGILAGEGFAYDPMADRFLVGGGSGGDIYVVDANTAASALLATVAVADIDGMSVLSTGVGLFVAGTVFAVDSGTLYAIDGVSFAATAVGATAGAESIAFGEDGTLYASDGFGNVFARDLVTGIETLIANSGSTPFITGSAVIPAPGSAVLLGSLGMIAARRRR